MLKKSIIILSIILIAISIQTVAAEEFESIENINTGDAYFDSLALNDGDGSLNSPYNSLSSNKIDSVNHFKNGTYYLHETIEINKPTTIIGESAENTVIECDYYLGIYNYHNKITIYNVTLKGVTIENIGLLNAKNVIFINTTGCHNLDGYLTTNGGIIYNHVSSTGFEIGCNIDNCTFINNSADYAGAIYSENVPININNTKFINNSAFSYGGAIGVKNGATTINNSYFEGDYSKNNVGGAIYSIGSKINIYNSNFINCLSNLGGAISLLSSTTTISNSKFKNNTARFDGGAIYQMYGSLSLIDNTIESNTANNGGGLFSDCANTLIITKGTFNENTAITGGAVFLNEIKNYTSNNTIFKQNIAKTNENVHKQEKYNTNINSDSYQSFSNTDKFQGTIPSRYSLVDDGFVSSIKEQGPGGNCWAFAALAALESCILKAGGKTYDFSEENMKNLAAYYSAFGWTMNPNSGGYDEMAIGYLTSWLGPILETEDPYQAYSHVSPIVMNSTTHVQNVYTIPERTSFTDNNGVKLAILNYGAIATSYYQNGASYNYLTNAYYNPSITNVNHAITIVGWDDNYPKENFMKKPAGDGAFIIKNSWGDEWGDNGYFYISYYDVSLLRVGFVSQGYTFILNDSTKYNKNYQYDMAGVSTYYTVPYYDVWYSNQFTSTENENLAAVSTYFNKQTPYSVDIYVNNDLKLTQTGTGTAGYTTIKLNQLIPLNKDDTFKVVIKVTSTSRNAGFPISEYNGNSHTISRNTYQVGTSKFSYNGKDWNNLQSAACIKAFTVASNNGEPLNTTLKITTTPNAVNKISVIEAKVTDSYGNLVRDGSVIFIVDGKNYNKQVTNGVATLELQFSEAKTYNIQAEFVKTNNFNQSKANTTITIPKNTPYIIVTNKVTKYGEKLTITVLLSDMLSETVSITFNNKNYLVNVVDGVGSFDVLENLIPKTYSGTVIVNETDNYKSNLLDFNVEIQKINLNITVNTTNSGENVLFDIICKDTNGNNANTQATLTINNKEYNLNINDGVGQLLVENLSAKTYQYSIISPENSYYLKANTTGTVVVGKLQGKISVLALNNTYGNTEIITIEVTDSNKKPIYNVNVLIKINNKEYSLLVPGGVINYQLPEILNVGKYSVNVILLESDAYLQAEANTSFEIIKQTPKILSETRMYNSTHTIIDVTVVDNYNSLTPISGKIQATGDINYTSDLIVNGKGTIIVPSKYNSIIVSYLGNDNYNPVSKNQSLSEYKELLGLNKTITITNNSVTITINLSKAIDSVLEFSINNNKKQFEVKSGKTVITLTNLEYGHYDYTLCLIDQNYNHFNKGSFDIEKPKSILTASNVEMYYKNGSYTAKLTDINGNPLASQILQLYINGETYKRTTKSDGTISFNINLGFGKYNITTKFNGTDSISGCEIVNYITVLSTIESKNIQKMFRNDSQFEFSLKNNKGNPLANSKATLNINGVFYNRTTNNVGIAILKLNLGPGTYIITIEHHLNNEITSYNVTILPILVENKEVVKYFKNDTHYTVKALDNHGNAIGGVVISFNINGVFYKRTTNSEGIATMNLNLGPGNYIITAMYNDFTVSNNVTVISTLNSANLDMNFQDGSTFKARLLDNQGSPSKGKQISFNVNGIFYYRTTDDGGFVNLPINLPKGEYIITTIYQDLAQSNTITIR